MSWLDAFDDADRARWMYLAMAYGLLAVSAVAAAVMGARPGAWALVAASAVWLAPLVRLQPRCADRPVLVTGYLMVLAVLGTLLVTRSTAFVLFAAVSYPLIFAMLPRRLVMAGVTVVAVLTVLAQAGPDEQLRTLPLLIGVAVPLLFAGWYVSSESDRRQSLIAELRAAMEENSALHRRLLEQARRAGVRDERQRMAGEIHDTIAQGLVAIAARLRAAGAAQTEEVRRRHLDQAADLAGQSLAEARRSVHALLPEALEDARLPEAIGRMAAQRVAGLSFEVTGTPVALAADLELTLFRVAQEALANVARHAGAARVGVTLSYEDDVVMLDVRDDGRGFEPAAPRDGYGLDGMRQRVRSVGGTLEIESEPGHGTAVAVTVPAILLEAER
ncbi:sensor histidine kinase [Nonomuraea longicatena]|uniref:Oxygen sensor histidine kinase NreB n=1 Tax=Nonomuraea longicatena TaxID=83682 RepID=A0ABP3Z6R5_9ACTN